ncbi:hypothetical protein Avbf_13820 [Armadillidium vulgare]|nr:hypothetical protein Avbf_13820 [Armadillidium vulgare]
MYKRGFAYTTEQTVLIAVLSSQVLRRNYIRMVEGDILETFLMIKNFNRLSSNICELHLSVLI